MSPWFVYIWTRIDDLKTVLLIIACSAIAITFPILIVGSSDSNIKLLKFGAKLVILAISVSFVNVAIPTHKDLAVIYVVPKLSNSKIITEDCPEIARLGIEALKQQLEKFTEKDRSNLKEK